MTTPPTPATGHLIKFASRTAGWRTDQALKDASVMPSLPGMRVAKDRLSVLLVEDEPGDALLVDYALRMSTAPIFHVTHVTTLAAAIAHVERGEPVDVVLLDLSLPDSSGIATVSRMQEAASKTPIVIMTGMDDPRFASSALEVGAQDYLIKSDDPERTVGRAIRYAITRMASLIERQALLERIGEQQRHLLEELAAARAMQFDLLPRPERLDPRLAELGLTVESFFEPSSGIGGDLWGCHDCGDSRMSFYTFDFAGHGIGAALNVFRLHALISEHWDPRRQPAETLRMLGSALRGLLGRGQFATMFLCTVDCERGEIEWASAGAPAPLLIIDGRQRFLDAHGVPLGLSKTPEYETHTEPFPPGASLLMYSDAITDAPQADGETFGEAGLAGLVEALLADTGEAGVERLIDDLYLKVRTPLEDDLTAVRIHRLAPPSPLILAVDGEISSHLAAQCSARGLLARPLAEAVATAGTPIVVAGPASAEAIARGLAPPYSGFVELGPEGLAGIGRRCFDTLRAGGLALSLLTNSAYGINTTGLMSAAIRRKMGIPDGEPAELLDICLAESTCNAIIHGNLGIASHLRATSKGFERFRAMMRERLDDPVAAARRLEINAVTAPGTGLTIAVSDRGNGFDIAEQLDRRIQSDAKSGRGLWLIRKACASMHGEDGGRTLVMMFAQ